MKRSLLFASLLVVGSTGAFAQAAGGPPKKPFVHRAPEFASWTITFDYKPAAALAPAQPAPSLGKRALSQTITKTNKTCWIQTTWSTGGTDEMWIYDGKQYQTANEGKSIVVIPPPGPDDPSPDYSDYNKHDFPGFEWLSTSTYKGAGTYQGKAVYMFEKMEGTQKSEAYLSTDTQLPIFSSQDQVSCTYTYNPPPTSPLALPKRYADFIETRRRGEQALMRTSPP